VIIVCYLAYKSWNDDSLKLALKKKIIQYRVAGRWRRREAIRRIQLINLDGMECSTEHAGAMNFEAVWFTRTKLGLFV